jgi:hypothetical protein
MSEGDLTAWAATAHALKEIDAEEIEFVPDFAEVVHAPSGTIGHVPGAFNVDAASLTSAAMTLFGVAMACIKYMAPKLFDVTVELGKEAFKKALDKRSANAVAAPISAADAARVHEYIRKAALERHLSEATAAHIANAVIAQLAMSAR